MESPDSPHIAVIEDDDEIRHLVGGLLSREGMTVHPCRTAAEFDTLLGQRPVDLAIVDIMLPGEDGLSLCRRMRATGDLPMLIVSARSDDVDRIIGLEIGADDYLPKPFNPRELLARIRALLRRHRAPDEAAPLAFGRLQIDPGSRTVRVDGEERRLTSRQFDLLLVLANHPGRVLSRERLMDLLGGDERDAFDRSIDVHVSRLRALIEDDPRAPRRLITIRGAGYVFARRQDHEP